MDTHGVPVTDFIFGLKGLAAADLIPIKTNGGTFATTGSGEGEGITPDTRGLFQAAASDKLADYLVDRPQLVISDGAPS